MMGWRDVCLAGAFITAIAATCGTRPAFAEAPIARAPSCGGDEIGRGTVRRILDGRTFVLADGREVRLAGIEVPSLADPPDSGRAMAMALDTPPPEGTASPRGRAAVVALNALAGGDEVVLRGETGLDRYGRLVAHAFVVRDGDEILLQRELLAEGLARVGDRVARACADDLLGREKAARGPSLAYGPIRIMRCSTPRFRATSWRIEANLRWSRAKSRRCGKAGPQSLSISGGGGRVILRLRT
jgi:endonuclease YncB( thermonuclease family)